MPKLTLRDVFAGVTGWNNQRATRKSVVVGALFGGAFVLVLFNWHWQLWKLPWPYAAYGITICVLVGAGIGTLMAWQTDD